MFLDYHHKSLYSSDNFFQFPKSEEEWWKIAKGFEEKWNFPHALGAVDGKHVRQEADFSFLTTMDITA
jgi:hypothetical protein